MNSRSSFLFYSNKQLSIVTWITGLWISCFVSFYRLIYPVASGGGVPLFSSPSMVDWSAKGRRQSTPFSQFASLPSSYGRQWSMVDWYCVWVASRGLGSLGDPSSSSPPFLVPLPSGSFVVSPNGILSVHVGGAFFRRLPNLLNRCGTFETCTQSFLSSFISQPNVILCRVCMLIFLAFPGDLVT